MRDHLVSLAGVGLAVSLLRAVGPAANLATDALGLLVVVLLAARSLSGSAAITAAVAGVFCYNFFFLPPIGTLTVSDPVNWVALAVFLGVALTVGDLSRRAKRRTAEAEAHRAEAERLYHELQVAFERQAESEAARRSERLKSALLDAVTHDLRTPLTSIKASVTALMNDLRSPALTADDRAELLEVVDEETDRLNHLVERMVAMARIEANALALSRRWSLVDDIVRGAIERAAPRLKQHTVTVEIPPDIPLLLVDAPAMEEAVYQLVENAAKCAPPATRISVTASQVGDDTVAIDVDDEGPGVPPEDRERIFRKFTQGSRTGGTPGLGMGLAIVKGLVEAHGGTVAVGNPPGRTGARFSLHVPIGDDEASIEPAGAEGRASR